MGSNVPRITNAASTSSGDGRNTTTMSPSAATKRALLTIRNTRRASLKSRWARGSVSTAVTGVWM